MISLSWPGGHVRDYGMLALVLLLYAVNLYFLIRLDQAPPKWDEAVHLRDSLVAFNVLSDPFRINLDIVRDIINLSYDYPLLRPSGYYPPLAAGVTSLFYFAFGTSEAVGVMSNVLFLSVLLWSVYRLGGTVLGREVGLLASVLLLLFPIILEHSVVYMLDLPLTAMVALALYALTRSEDFANRRYSVLSGVTFGLGMLTKWTFLFFIIGPLIHSALRGVRDRGREGFAFRDMAALRRAALNMILYGLAAIAVFGPYYFPILPKLLEETLRYSDNVLSNRPGSLFSVPSVVFYPGALWDAMITPYGCLFVVLGMAALWRSDSDAKGYVYALLFVPYLIFTFVIQNKQPRYMLPWLVPVSLLIAYGMQIVRSQASRLKVVDSDRFAVPILLIPFAIALVAGSGALRDSLMERSREDWNVRELVSLVAADLAGHETGAAAKGTPAFMGVIPDHYSINGQTLRYYAAQRRLPLNVIKLQTYEEEDLQEFIDTFDRYSYIVTKDRNNVGIATFQASTDGMHRFFYERISQFEHMGTFREPDGSRVSVYKRITDNSGDRGGS